MNRNLYEAKCTLCGETFDLIYRPPEVYVCKICIVKQKLTVMNDHHA